MSCLEIVRVAPKAGAEAGTQTIPVGAVPLDYLEINLADAAPPLMIPYHTQTR